MHPKLKNLSYAQPSVSDPTHVLDGKRRRKNKPTAAGRGTFLAAPAHPSTYKRCRGSARLCEDSAPFHGIQHAREAPRDTRDRAATSLPVYAVKNQDSRSSALRAFCPGRIQSAVTGCWFGSCIADLSPSLFFFLLYCHSTVSQNRPTVGNPYPFTYCGTSYWRMARAFSLHRVDRCFLHPFGVGCETCRIGEVSGVNWLQDSYETYATTRTDPIALEDDENHQNR